MSRESAEQSVDIPASLPVAWTTALTYAQLTYWKQLLNYNHDWGSPERRTKGDEDKTNGLTIKVMKFQMLL